MSHLRLAKLGVFILVDYFVVAGLIADPLPRRVVLGAGVVDDKAGARITVMSSGSPAASAGG